jgi:hypothetical protein
MSHDRYSSLPPANNPYFDQSVFNIVRNGSGKGGPLDRWVDIQELLGTQVVSLGTNRKSLTSHFSKQRTATSDLAWNTTAPATGAFSVTLHSVGFFSDGNFPALIHCTTLFEYDDITGAYFTIDEITKLQGTIADFSVNSKTFAEADGFRRNVSLTVVARPIKGSNTYALVFVGTAGASAVLSYGMTTISVQEVQEDKS